MDTVTLIRSAIRALLKVADAELSAELRAVLSSGDEYASNSKPQVDWDDSAARAELIDSRARDGYALLRVLDGRTLDAGLAEAAALLATVLGRARMRGKIKIDADFNLLAAAHNLARLAVLNIHSTTTGWATATA